MLFRSVLACLAGVAVLLALSLPATGAMPGSAAEAKERQGGPQTQPKRERSRPKSRRQCRVKQPRRGKQRHRGKQRGKARHIRRKRPCRRVKRPRRRIGAPTPAPTSPAPPTMPPPVAPSQVPVAPVPPAVCASSDTAPTTADLAVIRSATLCLVNAERTSRGLGPLVDNAQLTAAAQAHADDMAVRGYFSHTSTDGRTFDQRIRGAGYAGSTLAENIAWGGGSLGTPRQIVGSWMNSGGHRANILNLALRESGIGVAQRTPQGGSGGTYVHDFGAP